MLSMEKVSETDGVMDSLGAGTVSSSERGAKPVAERGRRAQLVEVTKIIAKRKRAVITRFL